jgi:nucleoside-diphosphate-sugar epimerase
MKKVIVTGANGFLGNSLIDFLQQSGYETIGWVREPLLHKNCSLFSINNLAETSWPEKADALIHCAWIYFAQDPQSDKKNLDAVEYLSTECRKRGIHFIFMSSFSAHSESISHYGRTKYEAETMLMQSDASIIKPGLVLGDGGLFQRIMKLVRTGVPLPLPGSGKQLVQTIWVEDLCKIILHLIDTHHTGIIALAHHQPISLREFYAQMKHLAGSRSFIISLPFQILVWISLLIKAIGFTPPIDTENLLGIKQSPVIDTREISGRHFLLSTKQTLEMLIKKADRTGSASR